MLLPLAGGMLDYAGTALVSRDWRRALRPALLASPLLLVCLLPTPFNRSFAEASGWVQLALVYAETGDGAGAVRAFEMAEGSDPAALTPELLAAAASFLERRGDLEAASVLRAARDGLAASRIK
ncbi:MAG TPA: hypothetical protein DEQ38_11190 [Elusimicrobia bacterium]|nr:hypothetical protein [Elusimicrobiota bacterium]